MKEYPHINDEPVYEDLLGHIELVESLIQTLIDCDPPYVVGVSGSWGAGKTSFLRKIWALMGASFLTENPGSRLQCCQELLGKDGNDHRYEKLRTSWRARAKLDSEPDPDKHGFSNWQVIWFNPWQHQFEASPLVALLQEIRAQSDLMVKTKDAADKTFNIAADAILEMLINTADTWSLGLLPKLDLDKIRQKGDKYEARRFETPLTSQTFSKYFEQAINSIAGDQGRLLICIDDLDRCEGEAAYRLLEALKLYLNVKNCIFILGMDQRHLEENLPPFKGNAPAARDYLDKMLQDRFVLPIPRDMKFYIASLLEQRKILQHHPEVFNRYPISNIANTLNQNLPHNPRKIKLFFSVWQRYLKVLSNQNSNPIDWRLTVVLSYLAAYEEPIYRSIELIPERFQNELLKFANAPTAGTIAGLALPPMALPNDSSGISSPSSQPTASPALDSSPRYLWIAQLLNELNQGEITAEKVRSHLLDSRKLAAIQTL